MSWGAVVASPSLGCELYESRKHADFVFFLSNGKLGPEDVVQCLAYMRCWVQPLVKELKTKSRKLHNLVPILDGGLETPSP